MLCSHWRENGFTCMRWRVRPSIPVGRGISSGSGPVGAARLHHVSSQPAAVPVKGSHLCSTSHQASLFSSSPAPLRAPPPSPSSSSSLIHCTLLIVWFIGNWSEKLASSEQDEECGGEPRDLEWPGAEGVAMHVRCCLIRCLDLCTRSRWLHRLPGLANFHGNAISLEFRAALRWYTLFEDKASSQRTWCTHGCYFWLADSHPINGDCFCIRCCDHLFVERLHLVHDVPTTPMQPIQDFGYLAFISWSFVAASSASSFWLLTSFHHG